MTWLSTKRARATSSMAESGQALVEAALVLPLMLMLVLGVVAVGIVGHTDAALLAVAQEAARAAATASDPAPRPPTALLEVCRWPTATACKEQS